MVKKIEAVVETRKSTFFGHEILLELVFSFAGMIALF